MTTTPFANGTTIGHRPSSITRRSAHRARLQLGGTKLQAMNFELWSKASRNIVGAFDTEGEALAAVRDAIDQHGRDYAEEFAIVREDSRGNSKLISEGAALVERAIVKASRAEGIPA